MRRPLDVRRAEPLRARAHAPPRASSTHSIGREARACPAEPRPDARAGDGWRRFHRLPPVPVPARSPAAEVVCLDNLLDRVQSTTSTGMRSERFTLHQARRHELHRTSTGPVDNILHFAGSPPAPSITLHIPIPTLKVGSLSTHIGLTLGMAGKKSRYLLASTSEALRRPRHVHPHARGLLGQRQPHRYPWRLRRGQALRRKPIDHGLSPLARRRYPHRPHLQYLRQAPVRWDDWPCRSPTSWDRPSADEPLTVYGDGFQTRSFCYVADLVDGHLPLAERADFHEPVNLGNPNELKHPRIRQRDPLDLSGSKSTYRIQAAAGGPSRGAAARISRAKKLLGWEPRVDVDEGLRQTIEWFRQALDR